MDDQGVNLAVTHFDGDDLFMAFPPGAGEALPVGSGAVHGVLRITFECYVG